jgi:hypothetical protein
MPNGLIAFCPLCSDSFSGTPRTSKSFQLPTFWLLDLASGSRGWLKQKGIFFGEMNHHTVTIVFRSCLLIFSCYSHPCCNTTALNSMAIEFAIDLPPTNQSIDDDAGGDSEVESTAMKTSSSLTHSASLMAKGVIPKLTYFFKRTIVSEKELQAYHHHGWLTGTVLSSILEVDVPTVHGSSFFASSHTFLLG